MGATDCPMDGGAFRRPCCWLSYQVNHNPVQLTCLSRITEAKWKTGSTGYDTFGALALGFYKEAATHLPFVMAVHNLWRAKLLYDLNYGQPNFRSRDSKKVQEILYEAGRGSYAESMYEAGPQSVTQVTQISWTPSEDLICRRWPSSSAQANPVGLRSSLWSPQWCPSHGGRQGPSLSWDLPTKLIPIQS